MNHFLFTSESVSEGHPDKIADQISDSILDAFLEKDRLSRVACEVLITKELVVVGGEISSKANVDIQKQVKQTIQKIGYDSKEKGLDYQSCAVLTAVNPQSRDIALGIKVGKSQGAGDQGLVFGYAIDETKELMPLSIALSHRMMKVLASMRRKNSWAKRYIWPDSKSQVTVQYENQKILHIPSLVVSTQHAPDVKLKDLKEFLIENLIKKVIPKKYLKKQYQLLINPTGRFVIGGPEGDCGLTGRKIIVDTYGGHGAHGGGAFSGKDPSKVDRSGAYVARHIAKNIVASGLAKKCLVQIAYAIGVAQPISFMIEDYGTLCVSKRKLLSVIKKHWDLRPFSIIDQYKLLRPIYYPTSIYGHFGREETNFTWEKLNKVPILQAEFSPIRKQKSKKFK